MQRWTSTGCIRVSETPKYVECRCRHLRNLAVLFDASHQDRDQGMKLNVVDLVPAIVCFIGLIASIIFYQLLGNLEFPPLEKDDVIGGSKTVTEDTCSSTF